MLFYTKVPVAPISPYINIVFPDLHDKNWACTNYLSQRALAQANNVRAQLQRSMEKFEVELVTINHQDKLHLAVRQALVCGFFMQVAHREGKKGDYLTVKDNQVRLGLTRGEKLY